MENSLKKQNNRYKAVAAVAMAAVILLFFTNHPQVANRLWQMMQSNLLLAFAVFMAVYFIKGIVMVIPVQGLYLAAAVIFESLPLSLAVNTAGICLCLSSAYFMGRLFNTAKTDRFIKKYPRLEMLDNFQKNNTLFFSYIIRIIGFLPCDAVSVYCGIRKLPYPAYLLGSVAGMLPGLLITSIMGASIRNPRSPRFLISVVFQIFTLILSVYLYNRIKQKTDKECL